jgi:Skp family chaperone for outer membrane proteins
MKKMTVIMILVLLVCVGLWGYRVTQAQDTATPAALKVGVVDVAKIMSECQECLDRDKMIQEKKQKVRAELTKMSGEADAMRQELENTLKPGSSEYLSQMQKWFDKMALREAYEKGQTQAFAADSQAWNEVFYKKMEAEIGKIARQDGFTLILDKDEVPLQARSASELSALIRTRKVLFSSASLDLTGKVLESMDRLYDREKSSGGEKPAAEKPAAVEIAPAAK